jgi:hypothetical protein
MGSPERVGWAFDDDDDGGGGQMRMCMRAGSGDTVPGAVRRAAALGQGWLATARALL